MHALIVAHRQRPIHHKPIHVIVRIHIKVIAAQSTRQIRARHPRPVFVHPVILAMIRVSADALGEGVARIPVRGEGGTAVEDQLGTVGWGGVLGKAGVEVRADCVAFLAIGFLLGEVLGVSGSEDV